MDYLDISSYIVQQKGWLFCGILVGGFLSGLFTSIFVSQNPNFSTKKAVAIFSAAWFMCLSSSIIIGYLPTHDRLLELKLSKIKNTAITQENLNKGVEHIGRVLKKLECKYLDCTETE